MALYGEVVEVQQLTPHMVRVVMGGDGLSDYTPTEWTDQYVNALFVPPEASYSVPFDEEEARQGPPEHRPKGRRYTIRRWDPDQRLLSIDFVVHGDVGVAGRWAASARPGDRLQIVGPHGAYRPDPEAAGHLMVGDESVLPAIGASLEVVPPGVPAVAVVVVDDEAHQLELSSPGDLRVVWVHRQPDPGDPDRLLRAVEAVDLPAGPVQVFVHGEAGEVRAVRKHLLGERGLPKDGTSISPYWRRTYTDESWREVKREWLAECEADI